MDSFFFQVYKVLNAVFVAMSIFYGILWVPFLLKVCEPAGSGGFALHQVSIIAGIVLLPGNLAIVLVSILKRPNEQSHMSKLIVWDALSIAAVVIGLALLLK